MRQQTPLSKNKARPEISRCRTVQELVASHIVKMWLGLELAYGFRPYSTEYSAHSTKFHPG
jgi:hypothetical protein